MKSGTSGRLNVCARVQTNYPGAKMYFYELSISAAIGLIYSVTFAFLKISTANLNAPLHIKLSELINVNIHLKKIKDANEPFEFRECRFLFFVISVYF